MSNQKSKEEKPRITREEYEADSLSTYPGYVELLETAIDLLDEREGIVVTEEILGETRTLMTHPRGDTIMTPTEHAVMCTGQAVIDEDLIGQAEVKRRLERALEYERNQ
jgi:hypothetical protein